MTPQPHADPGHEHWLLTRGRSWLAGLEGHEVSVALAGGARIDCCQLVSGGRHGVKTLWLFVNGTDRFVPLHRVIDIWETN